MSLTLFQPDDWTSCKGYESFSKFKTNLMDVHLAEPFMLKCKDMDPPSMFSDTTFRRYFDLMQSVDKPHDAARSKNQHKFALGLLRGPIYTETTFMKTKAALEIQIDAICSKLKIDRPEVQVDDYEPIDDLSPELSQVSFTYIDNHVKTNIHDNPGRGICNDQCVQGVHEEQQETQKIIIHKFNQCIPATVHVDAVQWLKCTAW